ncbi:exonuclease domain-containing protein [Vibrio mediterranei]|uniref:exonuclease domain-containing protein n=1 Tax=Vibrio mediterranei TaxID=689 RepID=UPI004068757F
MYRQTRTTLKHVSPRTLIAYDFETTGLSITEDQVCQIGAMALDSELNWLESLDTLAKPRLDVIGAAEAFLTTKLLPSELEVAPSEREAFQRLYALITKHSAKHMVGYNSARFDSKVLQHGLYRNLVTERVHRLYLQELDIFKLALMVYALRKSTAINFEHNEDNKPSFRLESLCPINGIDLSGAHCAIEDVQGTITFAKHLRANEPQLWQYWLNLSDPRNVEAICSANDSLYLLTGTQFGSTNRYTRPVAIAQKTPFGYYALDLTLNFDTDEKHLFQKVNKFDSPMITQVTEAQGDRLIEYLGYDKETIEKSYKESQTVDMLGLFNEWQQKHKKDKNWDNNGEVYRQGYDKFSKPEETDVAQLSPLSASDFLISSIKSSRVAQLAARILAFQGDSLSFDFNSIPQREADLIANFLKSKHPDSNKTTAEKMQTLREMIKTKENPKELAILQELLDLNLRNITAWESFIEQSQ